MKFRDKIAIITGGSQGFGKAITEEFSKRGAIAIIINRRKEKGEEAAKEISEKTCNKVIPLQCDISNLAQVEQTVKTVVEKFGRIDILVNNAGIIKPAMLHKMTENQWDEVIQINLKGYFNFTKECAKVMMNQKYGRIVNISSVAGERGTIGQINYGAAKAGVHGLTKSAAKELAKYNITVNAVAAGLFRTPMTDKMKKEIKERAIQEIPLKRMGEPWELAKITSFLASDDASYITGQIIGINGGIYM